MLVSERLAIFRIAVTVLAAVVFLALIPILGWVRAQVGFAVLALIALEPLVYRMRPRSRCDERDRLIHLRAVQAMFAVSWLVLFALLIPCFFRSENSISIQYLSMAVWIFAAAACFSHSVAVLVLYRWM